MMFGSTLVKPGEEALAGSIMVSTRTTILTHILTRILTHILTYGNADALRNAYNTTAPSY